MNAVLTRHGWLISHNTDTQRKEFLRSLFAAGDIEVRVEGEHWGTGERRLRRQRAARRDARQGVRR